MQGLTTPAPASATPAADATAPRVPPASAERPAEVRRGLVLGTVGVLIFALTLPMTRLAVGDVAAPQLPPWFVTVGRAALAGLLAAAWLLAARAPWPARDEWRPLIVSALGTVLGFPLFIALALREVPAVHAAVITGVLPLATAVAAAVALGQRASRGFWACAGVGAALVIAFAWLAGGGHFARADAWLLAAVASGAIGYVGGARVAARRGAEQAIGWVLVIALPFTLPAMALAWPGAEALAAVRPSAWVGFGYVTVFSMWIGFFAWYRGLALGGVMRVSQVQLIQPFATLLAAAPLLGERLEPMTIGFALAVVATVFVGRRMPVGPATAVPAVSAPAAVPAASAPASMPAASSPAARPAPPRAAA